MQLRTKTENNKFNNIYFSFFWCCDLTWALVSSFMRFLDHT